jgi:hypothetical protein
MPLISLAIAALLFAGLYLVHWICGRWVLEVRQKTEVISRIREEGDVLEQLAKRHRL